jgi:metal-responsive CopG/Arc/MetJ family transcriptional regulator
VLEVICLTTEKPRLLITVDDELLQRIDEYWHSRKLKNRSEAIRELIEKGLAVK